MLTELRGAPPSAIVFLTDGQTTEGESLSKAAELAARKGVPALRGRPGQRRAGPRHRADRALGRRRRVRRRRRPVPGQAAGPGLSGREGHGPAQGARAGLARSQDGTRDRVDGGRCPRQRSAQARRAGLSSQDDRRTHLHPGSRSAPARAPDRQQPDRARDHGAQGEAQGSLCRHRAALRVPLSQELSRARRDHRPEHRLALVRSGVQPARPLRLADLSRRQGRPLRLRRRFSSAMPTPVS